MSLSGKYISHGVALKNCNGSIDDFYKKYLKVKPLGEGTFGVAYLCKERETETKIVAKIFEDFDDENGCGIEVVDGEILEVKVMQKLNHPNIPKLLEWYSDGKEAILVMPFIGPLVMDLAKMKRKKIGSFSENNLKIMSAQILSAIKSIHDNGLIHQDIKPDNILYDIETGKYFLIDYGSTAPYDQNCKGFVCSSGSEGYLPPEFESKLLINGQEADVFCYGKVLIELFYGKLSPSQELKYSMNPSLEFSTLVSECLHEDPERRPTLDDILNSAWFLN